MALVQITAGSITGMTGLEKRPVFFLKMNGAVKPNLVVKGESGLLAPTDEGADSIVWGSKIMKNVNDEQVNVKVMMAAEIDVFKKAGKAFFKQGDAQLSQLSDPALSRWVKMPMIYGLTDADPYNETSSGYLADGARIKGLVVKFLDHRFWEELGKVLAVDIFVGNRDRFDDDGNWINQGNIMFAPDADGEMGKVLGLDFFQPGGGDRSNLAGKGGYPELLILTDKKQRSAFAEKCVQSVGKDLAKAAGKAGMTGFVVKLPDDRVISIDKNKLATTGLMKGAKYLANGIEDGAKGIKHYLRDKQSAYKKAGGAKAIPAGVLDRMKYLGW